MKDPTLRLTGALLLVLLGIWAGAWVYSSRSGVPSHDGIRVPAGQASAPNPSDLVRRPDIAAAAREGAFVAGGGIEGTEGTGLEDAFPPTKVPERLPQFSLSDPAGKPTAITSFGSRSLVINFWATWCAPCRREIPLLQAVQAEWAGRDVTVVGIAVDHLDQVLDFAKRFKIGYPLLIGEQDALDAAAAFGVDAPVFPFSVFTDRRGEVVALYIGELHQPQAELILSQVQKLNEGQIQLPAARQVIAQGLGALNSQRASPHSG
jgi:thiol-disulfide isomerase/thioredoxin